MSARHATKVVVNDRMQSGYVYYRIEPAGGHFAADFQPELTPKQNRYYLGRRSADDGRQIRRWRAIARHVAAIKINCEPGDLECRQRQAVLHWAYDSRRW